MRTLSSFDSTEHETAKKLLATTVALMMGRKFEEGDWSTVYCQAKGIPEQSWSNLHIDVMHEGLGVEQKMLCVPEGKSLMAYAGTTLMHPSATRSIRIDSTEIDAQEAMENVFLQYAELIKQRAKRVTEFTGYANPDMRIGWLLWERSLTEFLYFEEPMSAPNPAEYYARWEEKGARGIRKATKNLWIYERDTGKKRYSVTTAAGIKIQPYFDVPSPDDQNLIYFKVQGEDVPGTDRVRVWLTSSTVRELRSVLGLSNNALLTTEILSEIISESAARASQSEIVANDDANLAYPVEVTREAYNLLVSAWEGVSDEHRMQLLVQSIRAA